MLFEPLWGLEATYDDHLRLIGKRVVDFILVLINFFARCYGWGSTSEYRFEIGDFAPMGVGWCKISGRRDRPRQPFFFSENYPKWSFVRYKNLDRSYFRIVIIHAFDRQTDRRTPFSSLLRAGIPCSSENQKLAPMPASSPLSSSAVCYHWNFSPMKLQMPTTAMQASMISRIVK